jgi:hypothetical protein
MARADIPLREITIEEIWVEVQRLRNELLTHNHLDIGNAQRLSGVITGDLKSGNYLTGSSGWIIKEDGSAEFQSLTISGYIATGGAAADVNAGATEINPGMILISGATSLDDFRFLNLLL